LLVPQGRNTITAAECIPACAADPIITTAICTRNHAYMFYDVLVAVDGRFRTAAADGRL